MLDDLPPRGRVVKLARVVRKRSARTVVTTCIAGIIAGLAASPGMTADAVSQTCTGELTRHIPARNAEAASGSGFVEQVTAMSGKARDARVSAEVLAGNLPSFLRNLIPVQLSGSLADGQGVQVTICVTPDYLAVGSNRDFVRVPMGLPAAARIADRFGFLLPTTRMVDAIHRQSSIRLKPSSMKPTSRMRSTGYLWRHHQTIELQRTGYAHRAGELIAGQKKDLVLSNRLRRAPGRVAIYGWHRRNGVPIQPLSTVHGAQYADYSHGVRLVSATAFVDGTPQPLVKLLKDSRFAKILSIEGPIPDAGALFTSLYRQPDSPQRTASLRTTAIRD